MALELTDPNPVDHAAEILTPEALAFVAQLHQRFGDRRDELLKARRTRREQAAAAATLDTGETVTAELVSRILDEETEQLRAQVDPQQFERYYAPAKELIADLCLTEEFTDFLTLPAYELVK